MLSRARILVLFIASLGCRELNGPVRGNILATISTTAEAIDRDADGYILQVEGREPHEVAINTIVEIGPLDPGTYNVGLLGLAANCSVNGPNPVTVEVEPSGDGSELARINFLVACAPRTGAIRVLAITSGVDHDADGYRVVIAGLNRGPIATNGEHIVTGIRAGSTGVTLSGLAWNCSIEGNPTKTVTVEFGRNTEIAFEIRCVAAGSVMVTTSTSDPYLEWDNYYLELRDPTTNATTQLLTWANSSVTFVGLRPGTYVLRVVDLEPHCDPSLQGPQSLSVTAGSITRVSLTVTCNPAPNIAFVSDNSGNKDIAVINLGSGAVTRLTVHVAPDLSPAWSPDGSRIAFSTSRDGNFEIYVMNANGENAVRLTNHTASDRTPSWSPDGMRIAFTSERDGNSEIYVMNADGTNPVRLTRHVETDVEPAWSPDGSRIAFTSYRDIRGAVWTMNPDGSDARRITSGPFAESQPAWSPDGRRIAVSVGQSLFRNAINVINADGTGRIPITDFIDEASNPAWSPDGRHIVFTATLCDFYRYYCDPYLEFVGVGGAPYSWKIAGVVSDAAWQPPSGQ